jgi:hypothetical protein
MVVHPAFPGDKRLPRREKSLGAALGDAMLTALSQPLPGGAEDKWYAQFDELRAQVQRWTGSPLKVLDLSIWQQTNLAKTDPSLSAEITRDAVTIADELRVPALGTKQPRWLDELARSQIRKGGTATVSPWLGILA